VTEQLQQRETRSFMKRITAWARIETIGGVFELVFKAGVIVVALTYIFRPVVETEFPPKTAVFIDDGILNEQYGGPTAVPALVKAVADGYNRRNEGDIRQGLNQTLSQLPLPALCANRRISETVKQVYGEEACGQQTLGRGRYYERYMQVLNECSRTMAHSIRIGTELVSCSDSIRPLTPSQLKVALNNLAAAEYRRADIRLKNGSSVPAQGLSLRQAPGFVLHAVETGERTSTDLKDMINATNDFELRPNEALVLIFKTAAGNPDPRTEDRFGLNWQRPERSDIVDLLGNSALMLRFLIWSVILFFVVILFAVLITEYGSNTGA
jgi:hypothetical protein